VIAAGLQGAFLLARGRPAGMLLMEGTPQGALRSFWAALICLPAFLALRILGWGDAGPPPTGILRPLVAELLGYGTAWVLFALASLPMASAWGREAHWPRFISAWNWSNVVQYLILLAVMAPGALGLPALLAQGIGLAGLGYAIWIEWFVVRVALDVGGLRAAGMVLLDLMLGLFLGSLVQRLSLG
jgi:hypothetical protein